MDEKIKKKGQKLKKKWTLSFHIPRFRVLVLKNSSYNAVSFQGFFPGPKNRVKGGVPVLSIYNFEYDIDPPPRRHIRTVLKMPWILFCNAIIGIVPKTFLHSLVLHFIVFFTKNQELFFSYKKQVNESGYQHSNAMQVVFMLNGKSYSMVLLRQIKTLRDHP